MYTCRIHFHSLKKDLVGVCRTFLVGDYEEGGDLFYASLYQRTSTARRSIIVV